MMTLNWLFRKCERPSWCPAEIRSRLPEHKLCLKPKCKVFLRSRHLLSCSEFSGTLRLVPVFKQVPTFGLIRSQLDPIKTITQLSYEYQL